MKNAIIICIEGTDCSGKETQSNLLYDKLLKKGYCVKKYSFPQYDLPTGIIVGDSYLGKNNPSLFKEGAVNVDPIIASCLFAINRREAFLNSIESEISKNDYIILDRYVTSNFGHQVGKTKDLKKKAKIIEALNILEYEICELPRADKTIFLHMPYEAACELKKNRNTLDEHEKSVRHLKDAEKEYLSLCNLYNWDYINCLNTKNYKDKSSIKTIDEINEEVYKCVINVKTSTKKTLMTRY